MFESDGAPAGESAASEAPISPIEANYWWRQSTPAGAVLNKLMVLFILAPIALVLKSFYALSFVVFALMLPYGFFVRHLAVRAVRRHLQEHPEDLEPFQQAGIILN
jgi:hypothetical protein